MINKNIFIEIIKPFDNNLDNNICKKLLSEDYNFNYNIKDYYLSSLSLLKLKLKDFSNEHCFYDMILSILSKYFFIFIFVFLIIFILIYLIYIFYRQFKKKYDD